VVIDAEAVTLRISIGEDRYPVIAMADIGCGVRFAKPANTIAFRSAWLEREASLGNKTTYPSIVALCDDLLDDLILRIGIAGKVHELLLT